MTVIITKNSSTASDIPTSSDLVKGELAVNVADKRLFTENASAQVIELGTNPTSLTSATVTVSANLNATGTLSASNAVITGGTINGSVIGGNSPLAITGTTITANTGFVGGLIGNVQGNLVGNTSGGTHTGPVVGDLTGNVSSSSGTTSLHNLALTGTVDFNTARLTDIGEPVAGTDAATRNFVVTSINNLIDGAPASLDTLNELAAALNDDASFHSTVTTSLAGKLPLAGGNMTGAIAMGTNKITGLADPTSAQDAATRAYVLAQAGGGLPLSGGTMSGAIAMGNNKITGLATPTNAADSTSKSYVDGILGSATSAATSATNAANSATASASSASAASTSKGNAATSATASANSAAAAATTYDNFDDRYLGDKSSDPTVDNDGNALLTGALYWNTSSNQMKVYSGSAWSAVAPTATSINLASQVTGTLAVANGGTGVTSKTGSGSVVLNTTPTLTTPILSGITTTASGSMEFLPADYTMVIRGGGSSEGTIKLNCAANSHGQSITAQPHSESVTNEMLLPKGASSTLVSLVSTDTLTNKTWNSNAIGAAYGGTGLTAAGTSGNVLTSDGSTWQSTAPSGGGGLDADFVANSNVLSGAPVTLRSDGKVEPVAISNNPQYIPWSSETQFNAANTQDCSVEYNPLDSTRFVIGYNSGSGPKLVVGTISDSGSSGSISYSSPVTVSTNSIIICEIKFQPNTNKFVFLYMDGTGSNYGVAKLYSISGTTLTLLDTENFDTEGNAGSIGIDFSTKTTGLFIVSYTPYNTGMYAKARTGNISSNTLTFGTVYAAYSYRSMFSKVAFLYNSDSFVYSWKLLGSASGYSGFGETIIGTVAADNSTLSFGSVKQFSTDQNQGPTDILVAANRNVANSFVIVYTWNGSSPAYGTIAIACTVGGTTITLGSTTAITNWYANAPSDIVCYGDNKFLISYDGAYTGSNPQYGMYVRPLTTSGTSISLGTQVQVIAPGSRGGNKNMHLGFAPNDAQFVISYRGSSNYGFSILSEFASTTVNSSDFIGISTDAISAGATGSVTVKGGISTSVSGLSAGTTYYVQDNGTLATSAGSNSSASGKALSASSILLKGI